MSEILNYLFACGIVFSHIFGYVFSIISVFFIYKNWQILKKEKIFLTIIIFLVYGFVLSYFSIDKQKAFDEMFTYLTSWLPPFILGYYIVDKISKYKILMTNIIVFTIIVSLSILSYYGLFYKEVMGLLLSGSGIYGHINAFLWHISLGAMCVVMSSFSLICLLFEQGLDTKKRVILTLFTLFFIVSLFLTGSRGYYIAGFITYFLIFVFYSYKTKKIKLPLIITACAILLITIIYLTNPYIQQRIKNTNITKEDSITTRINSYKTALIIFKKHPIFGVGPRQSTIQKEYIENMKDVSGKAKHMHSMYFNILSDFGLIGIILFGFLIFFIFNRLIEVYKRQHSLFALILIFCWISILIGDSFDTVLRGPRVAMEYFWMTGLALGGTLINTNKQKEELKNEKK